MAKRLRVKELAQARGLSMKRLARKADMKFDTLSLMYHQPYRVPRQITLEKVAQALSVPVSALIEDAPDTMQ